MDFPVVSPLVMNWIDGLPVMPLSGLVRTKVKGWTDHRKEEKEWKRAKQWTDVDDVRALLRTMKAEGFGLEGEEDTWWMDAEYLERSEKRAREFVAVCGGKEEWIEAGILPRW
jgi:hypothetical protein